jgi:predicted amidohydrolase
MSLRIAACATDLTAAASPAAWTAAFLAQARCAADGGAHIAVFAEYAAAGLLALDNRWEAWEATWNTAAQRAATETGIVICAGTWPVRSDGQLRNRASITLPDGSGWHQDKLHPTPWERTWDIVPSDTLRVAEVAGARIAILTCYDIEFPELCRAAAQAGAEVLLVPSWTDDRHGFHRVRLCAQARCIEDGLFAVHAPLVGRLAGVHGFEQAVGSASVLTPCDTGLPADGVAVSGGWNQPEVVLADLDLERLRLLRAGGTVTPLADARPAAAYRISR